MFPFMQVPTTVGRGRHALKQHYRCPYCCLQTSRTCFTCNSTHDGQCTGRGTQHCKAMHHLHGQHLVEVFLLVLCSRMRVALAWVALLLGSFATYAHSLHTLVQKRAAQGAAVRAQLRPGDVQFVLEDFKKVFVEDTSPQVRRDSQRFKVGDYTWHVPPVCTHRACQINCVPLPSAALLF